MDEWYKHYEEDVRESIEEWLEKLEEFKHLPGYYEFHNQLSKLFNEKCKFRKLNEEAIKYHSMTIDRSKWQVLNYDHIPFFIKAKQILGLIWLPIYINRYRFADYGCLEAMSFLVVLNYYYHNEEKGLLEIFKKSFGGDFIPNLTKNTNDFKNKKYTEYNQEKLLNKIKTVKYHNKKAKKLQKIIEINVAYPTIDIENSNKFYRNVRFGGFYLSACSAVKKNRNVTCEDIFTGYNLTLKLLTEDLTEYIERDYNEEKVNKYALFKNL